MVSLFCRYYTILIPITSFILPTLIPVYFWGETAQNAWFIAVMLRWTLSSNITWCVNSVLHLYGNHPYDRFINPADNQRWSLFFFGDGFHNYHHTFPWDYKTGELGNYNNDMATLFIDCMAKIGWAYDLKTVSLEMIKRRAIRTGDGSHPEWGLNDTTEMDTINNNVQAIESCTQKDHCE